jgi:hypothetical protein
MSSTFKPHNNQTVVVELNTESGLIHLVVLDARTTAHVNRSVSLNLFNKAMDILKDNDHMFAIDMINNLIEE